MKTIKKLVKRLADYRYYRKRGHGIRRAWELAGVTL